MNQLIRYYQSLSILKKFLLPSALSFILLIPFYLYLVTNTVNIKKEIQSINSKLLPLQESVYRNKTILEKISTELNSAVTANEIEWIENTKIDYELFNKEFNHYKNIEQLFQLDIQSIQKLFHRYYELAYNISLKLIQSNGQYDGVEKDSVSLVKTYNLLLRDFDFLSSNIKLQIESNINKSYSTFDLILVKSLSIFITWLILSILTIYFIYKDFSNKIKQVVEESEKIASGEACFNKRMNLTAYDEFGKIIRSLNIYIDKLHASHIDLERTKDELSRLYILDQLTGVYNRRKIDEVLEEQIQSLNYQEQNRFSIILIDIDHFKDVNDTYGHLVGDSVLKEFANILQENIRGVDFLGRWGGEEFIIVCIETNSDGAVSLAKKLQTKINEFKFSTVGAKTASFGVASIEFDMTVDNVIESADKALYEAKKQGRDRVICAEVIDI